MMEIYTINTVFLQDDNTFKRYLPFVSEYRKTKVDMLRFRADKALSLGAGLLLAFSLKKAGIEEKSVVYMEGKHGKPYFDNEHIHFSLSHSGQRAAIVLDTSECGIDIEQIKPYKQQIAKRFFSDLEQAMLRQCENNDSLRDECFTRIWTRKESYGKFTGQGLNFADDIQKRVFDDKDMIERGIYFKEDKIHAEQDGDGYILSVCSRNKEILVTNVIDINAEEIDCVIHRN